MTLSELISFLQHHRDALTSSDAIALAQRLTNLALFEHGISEAERAFALQLLPALEADIEQALNGQPGAFAAYQEAALFHRGQARHSGYGSLQWLVDEQAISAVDIIPFIARQEHADLLPGYLEMMEPDVIHQIRGVLLQELSASRAQPDEPPLDVLHRLATNGDGALTILLDGRQLGALRRARSDRDTAEAVLTELGLSK